MASVVNGLLGLAELIGLVLAVTPLTASAFGLRGRTLEAVISHCFPPIDDAVPMLQLPPPPATDAAPGTQREPEPAPATPTTPPDTSLAKKKKEDDDNVWVEMVLAKLGGYGSPTDVTGTASSAARDEH